MWLLFLTQEEFRLAHLRKVVAQLEPVRGEKRRIQELQEHESVSHDTSSVCVCVYVCVCVCVCMCVCVCVCVCACESVVCTYILFDRWKGNMAEYCTSMQPYFHKTQASENTAQECNIQPYCLLNHQIIHLLYTTLILVAFRKQTATAHAQFKGCCCVHI